MITFRREYLDHMLNEHIGIMKGRVIDIGGKKKNKRGSFCPPIHKVISWEYVNTDPSTEPDHVASAMHLPFNDNIADTVVMTEILEYIENPGLALSEAFRILKPGGFAIVTTPFLNPVHGDWQFDRYRFTAIRLKELAKHAGFSSIQITEMGGLGAVMFDLLQTIFSRNIRSKKTLPVKIAEIMFKKCVPIFRLLDAKTIEQRQFITTGYFLVLKRVS